jgi:hypothetical protein
MIEAGFAGAKTDNTRKENDVWDHRSQCRASGDDKNSKYGQGPTEHK